MAAAVLMSRNADSNRRFVEDASIESPPSVTVEGVIVDGSSATLPTTAQSAPEGSLPKVEFLQCRDVMQCVMVCICAGARGVCFDWRRFHARSE